MSADLIKLSREDLDTVGLALGVENAKSLPNKEAVAEAIIAAKAPVENTDALAQLEAQRDEAIAAKEQTEAARDEAISRAEAAEERADALQEQLDEAADADADDEAELERRPLERRESTGEWRCPFCDSPGGANESRETRCGTPYCGATVDGDEVVKAT